MLLQEIKMIKKIIGLGASAGGIEALVAITPHLRKNGKSCYVLAQHIASNGHTELIARILKRESKLKVVLAEDNIELQVDHIYLIPSGFNGVVKDERLQLIKPKADCLSKPSINALFNSLACEYKDKAIGVILSGTGSDGALGCVKIKDYGGITIAQDPTSAIFDGMPNAAINTGKIDHVLNEKDIPSFIANILNISSKNNNVESELITAYDPKDLESLFERIKKLSGVDFGLYRVDTIIRRLKSRMSILEIEGVPNYLEFIKNSPEELKKIQDNFFVSFSYFFRDQSAFIALELLIVDRLLNKKEGEAFRVWVAGCASGEEAYSIAIVISECLKKYKKSLALEIICTDLNEVALHRAKIGSYSELAIKKMPSSIVSEYFYFINGNFQVVQKLKDYCRFENQNVLDSANENLDLITCRNLLIYMKRTTQNKIILIFKRSLIANGILFLGQSDKIEYELEKHFEVYDYDSKLYIRK